MQTLPQKENHDNYNYIWAGYSPMCRFVSEVWDMECRDNDREIRSGGSIGQKKSGHMLCARDEMEGKWCENGEG